MNRLLLISILTLIAAFPTYAAPSETGEWSEALGGIQGRLIISEDQSCNGTCMLVVYLELKNVSPVAEPFEVYFDTRRAFQCRLLDKHDNSVTTTNLPTSILVPPPFWLSVPYDGSVRFRVSVCGFMVPRNERALIPMLCGDWLLKSGDPDEYWFEATLVVDPPKVDVNRRIWKGRLKLPKVKVPA